MSIKYWGTCHGNPRGLRSGHKYTGCEAPSTFGIVRGPIGYCTMLRLVMERQNGFEHVWTNFLDFVVFALRVWSWPQVDGTRGQIWIPKISILTLRASWKIPEPRRFSSLGKSSNYWGMVTIAPFDYPRVIYTIDLRVIQNKLYPYIYIGYKFPYGSLFISPLS